MSAPRPAAEADRAVIVLEVPEPVARLIGRIQAEHGYRHDPGMPIHLTLAGSNGVGELELDDASRAFATLDSIVAATAPIAASFGPAVRFAGTNTFALTLVEERPIAALHRAIAQSGLPFEPSPFPFKAHCTLTSGIPKSEEDSASLLATRVPGIFVLERVSVHVMTSPTRLLHRGTLGMVPNDESWHLLSTLRPER